MHPPKRVVKDSAASRKSLVDTALSLAASMGTSTNDFCRVSSQVLPGGMTGADMIAENSIENLERRKKEERVTTYKEVSGEVKSEVAVTCPV